MRYTLMHKNQPVVDLRIDDDGKILKVLTLHNHQHLPYGTYNHKNLVDRAELNEWWTLRAIPLTRDGIKDIFRKLSLTKYKIYNPGFLLPKCFGLSLSDQYWIHPEKSDLQWEKINFFQNEFSPEMGEILFGKDVPEHGNINLHSPDNTADGWLKKRWIILNGERILIKGGSGVFQQEPYNEMIATALCRRLNIPHVPYTVSVDQDGNSFSLCPNFLNADTELIPAWLIRQSAKKYKNVSEFNHLLSCSQNLEIPDFKKSLEQIFVLDYIIANEDRHFYNFGFIRHAESLTAVSPAPIYDSGTSLWHNTPIVGSKVESKPFNKSHTKQLEFVQDLSWFNPNAFDDLADEIYKIFSSSPRIDLHRQEQIVSHILSRIEQVAEFQNKVMQRGSESN